MKKVVRRTVAATMLVSGLVFLVPHGASADPSLCKTVEGVVGLDVTHGPCPHVHLR